ncbi:MAG: hypothetical protein RMI45_02295 [Ignisphaera sp.]|nr:hypothetical protein [Ignisphaera sp.]MDW8085056.1 hypothetical protein [Ignisphaera sp.]
MPNTVAVLAISVSLAINAFAFYGITKIIARYKEVEESSKVDRVVRKAHISRKKMSIATLQVRRIRSRVFRLSMFQFLIPFTAYVGTISIYLLLSFFIFGKFIEYVELNDLCLAPIPLEIPINGVCRAPIMWIHFLIFLLFLPLYDYYARRTLKSLST